MHERSDLAASWEEQTLAGIFLVTLVHFEFLSCIRSDLIITRKKNRRRALETSRRTCLGPFPDFPKSNKVSDRMVYSTTADALLLRTDDTYFG